MSDQIPVYDRETIMALDRALKTLTDDQKLALAYMIKNPDALPDTLPEEPGEESDQVDAIEEPGEAEADQVDDLEGEPVDYLDDEGEPFTLDQVEGLEDRTDEDRTDDLARIG